MTETVYIAGKITGLPYNEVVDRFNYWHKILNDLGYIVYNPTVFVPKNTEWHKAMQLCLPVLHKSTKALFIAGWSSSHGACIEMEQCIKQKKPLLSPGFIKQQWEQNYKHFKIA